MVGVYGTSHCSAPRDVHASGCQSSHASACICQVIVTITKYGSCDNSPHPCYGMVVVQQVGVAKHSCLTVCPGIVRLQAVVRQGSGQQCWHTGFTSCTSYVSLK